MIIMPRKGENIYKRKDGRWEGRYKKGRKENGQLKYGYLYGKTYNQVKQDLYKFKVKYQTNANLQDDCSLSYENWGILWLSQQKNYIKISTYSTYEYKLKKYVFPYIGDVWLNQITREKIQSLIDIWQNQGLKASTIHVIYQIVKKTTQVAFEQQIIYQLPCQKIYLPKKKKAHPKSLTRQDQHVLEKKVKSLPLYKGLPVLLALNAGLRIGEISALQWKDIDFDKRLIHVQQTLQRIPSPSKKKKTQLKFDSSKTESSNRIIPISVSLYKYLKKWRRKSSGSYVCSRSSKPLEPRLLTYYFHQIRKSCNFNNIHFHQLRHTFATRCIESNGDVASVSKLLGHSSIQTTLDVYTDSLLESRQRVIVQMDKAKI